MTGETDFLHEKKNIRVGFLLPSLIFGGAERWSLDLARYCNPSKVTWSGCAVVNDTLVDPAMLKMMEALMPVFHNGCICERGVIFSAHLNDAVSKLLSDSDVVITWEVDEVLRSHLNSLDASIVNVAHRNDPKSLQPYVANTDNLVTVWGSNCGAFGEEYSFRVKVIPNGIDLNRSTPLEGRDSKRAEWGCNVNNLVVGYIGRIHPQKNYIALARAVNALKSGAMGVVIGSRSKESMDAELEFQEIAGERVLILPPNDDIGSVLSAIDVFFHPSPEEVCSLSLLEAWAAGVPVVATRVGSVPELEREVGPLVVPIDPDDNAEQLAASIRYAISDSPEIEVMRNRAADLVRSRFGVRKMASDWTKYLLSIANGTA